MLLKHGAYDVFKEGKDGEETAKKFCEDDIESILSRAKVCTLRMACVPKQLGDNSGEPAVFVFSGVLLMVAACGKERGVSPLFFV